MARQMKIGSAVERYLNERKEDVSDSTLYNHSSQLKQFTEWCRDEQDTEKVAAIDGWLISDFKVYRRDDCGIENVSLYNQMTIIRVFIKWCESRGLLEGISENIMMPTVENDSKEEILESDRGQEVLDSLDTYEYASLKHTLFAILWTTGMRIGTARTIDVDDYDSEERFVEIHHRPETDTPLKNKTAAERQVNLHGWVCTIIDDYLTGHRHTVTDDHGRDPLLTTRQGRAHRNTLRKQIRAITRPCEFDNECPFGESIEKCEATSYDAASKCPGSVPPHSLRRSAITNFLNEGHSKELISDRMDVSVDTLEKHYDARSEGEKRELRREMFDIE